MEQRKSLSIKSVAYLPQTFYNCPLLEFMSKIEHRINCLAFNLTLSGLKNC